MGRLRQRRECFVASGIAVGGKLLNTKACIEPVEMTLRSRRFKALRQNDFPLCSHLHLRAVASVVPFVVKGFTHEKL